MFFHTVNQILFIYTTLYLISYIEIYNQYLLISRCLCAYNSQIFDAVPFVSTVKYRWCSIELQKAKLPNLLVIQWVTLHTSFFKKDGIITSDIIPQQTVRLNSTTHIKVTCVCSPVKITFRENL